MDNNKKVEKAVSTEEAAVLNNVKALIDEILSMSQGTPEAKAAQPKPAEEPAAAPAQKAMITTQSEGAAANDPAEKKIDENQTPQSKENVDEIAKAMQVIADKLVKKDSQPAPVDPVLKAIESLTKIVGSVVKSQQETDKCLAGVLQGLGVAEQLQIAQKSQTPEPVVSPDNAKTLEFLATITKAIKGEEKPAVRKSNSEVIRENLADPKVLKAFLVP